MKWEKIEEKEMKWEKTERKVKDRAKISILKFQKGF